MKTSDHPSARKSRAFSILSHYMHVNGCPDETTYGEACALLLADLDSYFGPEVWERCVGEARLLRAS